MGKVEELQRQFKEAQEAVREAELQEASLEGQRKEALARLEKEHGVSTADEGREKLTTMRADDEKDQTELGEIQTQLAGIMEAGTADA